MCSDSDEDRLSSSTVIGIAWKVAADGGPEQLSDNQYYHYDQELKYFLEMKCASRDCEELADLSNVTEAIQVTEVPIEITAYCEHCLYIGEQNAKD